MTGKEVLGLMTRKGIRVGLSINPANSERSFFAFPSPDNPVSAEDINLLREHKQALWDLHEQQPSEFLLNFVQSKLLFWKREAELAGCDFSSSNWRSDEFQKKLNIAVEQFVWGKASIDEVKMYHDEVIRSKSPRKFVRVGNDLVKVVTPQVDFQAGEMDEVCALMGITKEEYAIRFL